MFWRFIIFFPAKSFRCVHLFICVGQEKWTYRVRSALFLPPDTMSYTPFEYKKRQYAMMTPNSSKCSPKAWPRHQHAATSWRAQKGLIGEGESEWKAEGLKGWRAERLRKRGSGLKGLRELKVDYSLKHCCLRGCGRMALTARQGGLQHTLDFPGIFYPIISYMTFLLLLFVLEIYNKIPE